MGMYDMVDGCPTPSLFGVPRCQCQLHEYLRNMVNWHPPHFVASIGQYVREHTCERRSSDQAGVAIRVDLTHWQFVRHLRFD